MSMSCSFLAHDLTLPLTPSFSECVVCRPALLLVGDVTVDVVDGKRAVVNTWLCFHILFG